MKPFKRKRIVFGIDEGLPSRVAASILRNQDFDLLAVHLRCDLAAIGEDPATYPSAVQTSDLPAIEKFCESLGVPLKTIDVTEETLAKVYTPFLIATLGGKRFAGSAAWVREILAPHLDSVARARDAELFATGHFARWTTDLHRHPEAALDQSRSLVGLDRATLERFVLPVGEVSVEMLMRLAREIGAATKADGEFELAAEMRALAEDRARRGRWEWTDAQLLDPRVQVRAGEDFFKPGPIGGADEFAVGEHRGIPFFSVGAAVPQIPGAFVLETHPQSRMLTVATESRLGSRSAILQGLKWYEPNPMGAHRRRRVTVEKEPPNARVGAIGPTRVEGFLLEYPGGIGEVHFEVPLSGLGIGETLVFFEESRVLGSATITEIIRAFLPEKAIESDAPSA